jgi:hypothetical protein
MSTEHRHSWTIDNSEPAPEGLNGRKVTMSCTTCTDTRSTITLKTDTEIQTELDAYNAESAD